jgi:hypothetical protein
LVILDGCQMFGTQGNAMSKFSHVIYISSFLYAVLY